MVRLVGFFSLVLVLLSVSRAAAQATHVRTQATIRVTVAFPNGARLSSGFRVQLIRGMNNSTPTAAQMTDSSGEAEFGNVDPGDYRVSVSGQGIQTTESGTIQVEDGSVFQSAFVTVHRSDEGNSSEGRAMGAAVAVSDLNVPKKAAEEFDHGNVELDHQNWGKAVEHYAKATSIYPKYSAALYAEAVAYSRLNQTDNQKKALESAIAANDHCVPALINLAKIDVAEKKNAQAGGLLGKATLADPENTEALALLVRVDFLLGRYEQSVADAKKVHGMSHEMYPWVHYTAASAYEHLGKIPESVTELKLYLEEDPQSPRADAVRQTILAMEKPGN